MQDQRSHGKKRKGTSFEKVCLLQSKLFLFHHYIHEGSNVFRTRTLEYNTYTLEEIKEAETYMRITALDEITKPKNNRSLMLEKMEITRKSRREFLKGKKQSSTVFLNISTPVSETCRKL